MILDFKRKEDGLDKAARKAQIKSLPSLPLVC